MPDERFTTMQAEKVAGREVFGELETDMLQDKRRSKTITAKITGGINVSGTA